MNGLRARSKIWLEIDGAPVLGHGRMVLLEAVDQAGSISAAARSLDMPYRKAWSQLSVMEKQMPFPLMERKVGGKGGGKTSLTPETRELLAQFRQLLVGSNEFVDERFSEVFR